MKVTMDMMQIVRCSWNRVKQPILASRIFTFAPRVQPGSAHDTRVPPQGYAPKLAADLGLIYLSPLIVTNSICIYGRARVANHEAADHPFLDIRSESGAKRPSSQSIGWLELNVGPLVFSFNTVGSAQ